MQDPKLGYAVEIDNASFTWDGPSPVPDEGKEDQGKKKSRGDSHSTPVHGSDPKLVKEEALFKLMHVDLRVPRGQLVAIVGAVGSGKTSLLQGLIGDMRRTEGSVRVGGSVAYCSQSAWIQVGHCDQLNKDIRALISSRTPPSAKIFVLVGLSKRSGIGKPFMMPVWRPTWTCCLMVT